MIRAVGEKSDGKCRILVAGPFPEFGLGYFGRDEEYGLKSTGILSVELPISDHW